MSTDSTRIPVEEGETYHVEIRELGREGDGIGYVDDFVLIVPDATLGDSVTVKIDRVENNFAVASSRE